ncbi:MAG: hypothetical protein A2W25_00795 [candidate division Zixibacteria bacterium RBG_16_53_22]|nr:MAG: hypothetical protein A2W25_00795 [candidate division Zixibacteria bacterium RBG_16_53_22]
MAVKIRNKKYSIMKSVRHQYENWPFPGTDFRSREWLLLLRQIGKIINSNNKQAARFADIGCGTGHTVLALARIFTGTQFWGIDISRNSIRQAKGLASDNQIENVTFRNINIITDRLLHLGKFRVVYCAGVLHHIENLDKAFARVATLVEPGGYLILWLYGRYGRARHRLNQKFLKTLASGLSPSKTLELAHEFAVQFKDRLAADGGFYTPRGSGLDGVRWLLDHPHWLADQMIPGFENAFDLGDIFRLLDNNGLVFHNWLGVSDSITGYTSSKLIEKRFAILNRRDRLLAIEYLIKPDYYFIVARRA